MENKEIKQLTLNEKIITIRVDLQSSGIKKTGKNKYAGFDYFELSDFLPTLNELMLKYNINDNFTITGDEMTGYLATLTLISGEEKQEYSMPFKIFETPINTKYDEKTDEYKTVKSMQDIQYLGALNTYYNKYLYLNAFGITDGEVIDSMNNDELDAKTEKKAKKSYKATEAQLKILRPIYTGANLTKLLTANKISKLEDLPIGKASELIKALNDKKTKEEKEIEAVATTEMGVPMGA